MRKVAAALALACVAIVGPASPAIAALPTEDTIPAPGLDCIQRVPTPALVNVIDAKWSPDASMLAVVRFERRPSSGTSGYLEDEVLDLVDMRTGKVRSLGSIEYGRPTWSPSGKYLAYWGYKADFLEVMDRKSGEVVAKLTPTNPEYRWQGDTLLFIQKSSIRAWTGANTPENVSRLGESKVPHYPDDVWGWSGDGSRFSLTRYDEKDPVPELFIGTTATGDAYPVDLPGALYTEWAPSGSVLLVRYATKLELRDFAANTVDPIPIVRTAVHSWGPDGRTLLLRTPRASTAAGDVYEQPIVVWPVATAAPAILPDVFGVRTFSADGRYFSGTVRTDRHDNEYAVFRCYEIVRGDPAAVPVSIDARQAKIDGGTGRLIRPVAGPISQFLSPTHTGVDIAAPYGSPIVAADSGIVTKTGWQEDGEGGLRVCVQHSGGLETCYYHTSTSLVTVGQRVARGEAIAIVGMSGRTNGPHVHWEAKLNGKVIDPLLR